MNSNLAVLVTGATGYIGGRLIPRLLSEGHHVRVLARDPSRLQGKSWLSQVEVFQGDVLQPETIRPALEGSHVAYYLIHSMQSGNNFHERDLKAAQSFAFQARQAGLQRIIYLGGLGDPESDLSQHLRSRQQTGETLRAAGVPVTEFRAGIVVGTGSISFEMIRYLTERIPIMISPRWVSTRTQPISIFNVLDYLVASLYLNSEDNFTFEIGGPEVITYGDMLQGYAEERGLRRWIVTVPVLTPRLSSYWVHWVTPISAAIARPLIEGLRNEVIVQDDAALQYFPEIRLIPYQQAVREALSSLEARKVETAWSDDLFTSQGDKAPANLSMREGMIIERRSVEVEASPDQVYKAFTRLGGENGWLYANWAWRLRGLIDRMIGGVGFRQNRRDQTSLRAGDTIDFWRVESLEPNQRILLRAEMKLPGRAWLQFESHPSASGWTILIQTAFFAPKGLTGLLYWYVLYPVHSRIFSGLFKALSDRTVSHRTRFRSDLKPTL